jgi:hypothetical protein
VPYDGHIFLALTAKTLFPPLWLHHPTLPVACAVPEFVTAVGTTVATARLDKEELIVAAAALAVFVLALVAWMMLLLAVAARVDVLEVLVAVELPPPGRRAPEKIFYWEGVN